MRFRTKLLLAGKTATGFEVPTKVIEALGGGKRPPVRVTINGYTYRSTVAVMGGKFMVGVNAGHRERANVEAGQTVTIELALDTAPREVEIPPDLKKALARDAKAKARFDAMSYTNRREIAEAIAGAKKEETRERRLAKAMDELSS
jgi:hypothetical protein